MYRLVVDEEKCRGCGACKYLIYCPSSKSCIGISWT
ncbi:MAG: hypothetical protein DRJ98_08860 [Thermoprotei archaeon]|nr:MAG: hypothetical protein DRJ98_08860 [Thermoprotei archaeon]